MGEVSAASWILELQLGRAALQRISFEDLVTRITVAAVYKTLEQPEFPGEDQIRVLVEAGGAIWSEKEEGNEDIG